MRLDHLSALLPAIMAARVSAIEAPMPGYKVFIPQWEVAAKPGGETFLLNGTIEQVLDQLHEINPDFEELDWLNTTAMSSPALAKRTDFSDSQVDCDIFIKSADRQTILNGIGYLNGLSGQPERGAGPSSCGRVSCSWKDSIWWCNESTKSKRLVSFDDIGDGASKILNTCKGDKINGKAIHRDNWSVIVRGGGDC